MIDRYSRTTFEIVLPRVAGQKLWSPLGMCGAEYCYIIPVKPGVLIYIRSTVRADDLAADVAKDSIRCWLASDDKGSPLGSKDQRWIARTSGWNTRLLETLRTLWRLGSKLPLCPKCEVRMHALKVKKENENKGRWFSSCPQCKKFGEWLTPPVTKEMDLFRATPVTKERK